MRQHAQAAWRSLTRGSREARADRGDNGHPVAPDMSALRESYADFVVPTVGYGTVRDFSDSLERLTRLATAQGDLKDAQRPWMVKALWSLVPRGGRVVEIGAGQPYVADLLQRSGLDVTIVDPYDGSGNGPVDYERYRKAHPALKFVRMRFDARIAERLPAESFDAVFSISVLEHVSEQALASVISGARALLRDGGHSIHNVDHSIAGVDQAASLSRLRALARLHGVSEGSLGEALREAQDDPETYFLSAESHERWRAYLALEYEDYPMRRIISISVAGTKEDLG